MVEEGDIVIVTSQQTGHEFVVGEKLRVEAIISRFGDEVATISRSVTRPDEVWAIASGEFTPQRV